MSDTSKITFFIHWCCQAGDGSDLCGDSENKPNGYLQWGTPETVTPTEITIESADPKKTITINPIDGVTEASSENYHFSLAFSVGDLAEPEAIRLEAESWSISYAHADNFDYLYLLWTGDSITLPTHEIGETPPNDGAKDNKLILNGLAAKSTTTKNTKNVTFAWNKKNVNVKTASLLPQNSITLELEMVKTTGLSNIPLYVGFVGDNKVLNTHNEKSNLQLRLTNTSLPGASTPDITFDYNVEDSTDSSRLVVILEAEENESQESIISPWVLGKKDQVNNIKVSIEGWNDPEIDPIIVQDATGTEIVKAIKWTLTPKSGDVVLKAQETLLINLEDIYTAHPTGETNLYLRYENMPDYQDGQFICQIEKAPLVFDDKVRVGTKKELDGLLTVRDGISLDYPGEIQHTGPLIFRSDVDETNDTSSVKFLKKHESTPLMELNADGDLNFNNAQGQKINLYGTPGTGHGMGIQCMNTYFRTNHHFAWHKGGVHDDNSANPGDGGTLQMQLVEDGTLKVLQGRIKDKTGFVMPVGTIVPYAGSNAPEGWLLCDGSSFFSSEYPELYEVLGNNHYTPNLKGRFIVGVSSGYPLNDTGGEEQHRLTVSEMPEHNHEYSDKCKYLVGKGVHTINDKHLDDTKSEVNLFLAESIKSAGGGRSHENRPPYHALNYIIKA